MHVQRFLMDASDAGAAGGIAAADAAAGAAAGTGAGAAGASGGDAAAAGNGAVNAPGNALAAGGVASIGAATGGAAAGATAGATGTEPPPAIPEKFLVKDAAGQIDHAATALKIAQAYTPLEKRMGAGDAPPQSVEGYKVNVPEAFKDAVAAEDLAKTPGVQALLKDLHGAGASQKVVDAAVAAFMREGAALRSAMPAMDSANCEAELRQADGWKSDEQYRQQVGLAFNAGKQIFGKDFDGIVKDYGNDARLIRGLASIGKEMQEDMPAPPEAQAQLQESVDTLMASAAYLNPNDPQHATTVAKVTALTAKMTGQRVVAGGRTHSFKTA
jgi:hypothetical protein